MVASISIRPSRLWFSAAMKRANVRLSSAVNPIFPCVKYIRTQTHDYYRHGTVTFFAALDYLSGKVSPIPPDVIAIRSGSPYPESITVDNGSEFCSRVMDAWAYRHGV